MTWLTLGARWAGWLWRWVMVAAVGALGLAVLASPPMAPIAARTVGVQPEIPAADIPTRPLSGSSPTATTGSTRESVVSAPSLSSSAARPVEGVAGRWVWPVPPPRVVVRAFDPPQLRWLRGHRGLDLAAAVGTPVTSVADGVVVFAGIVAGRGVVSVDHHDGIRSSYEPVTAWVTAGRSVRAGAVLGVLAAPHRSVARSADLPETSAHPTFGHCAVSCLHLGARKDGQYLDPAGLLAQVRVVLLPLR